MEKDMEEKFEKKDGRVIWVDVAKFMGISAIVYGHTISTGITNRYVYSFHVPLFFFLLGVVFSITHTERKTFGQLLKRNSYALLLPYYFFSIISTAVIFVAARFIAVPETKIFTSVKDLVINILIGYCDANRPLWFLPCTLVITIIAYAVIVFTNVIEKQSYRIGVLVAVAIMGCGTLYITEEFTDIKFLFWKLDGALHMLPFFIAGYVMNEYGCFAKISNLPICLKILISAALMIVGAVSGLLNDTANYLGNYYGNIAVTYLSAFATSIGICFIAQMIPSNRFLIYIGQHTLGILLMHKFPVLIFQKAIPLTSKLLKQERVSLGLLVTLVSIVLCCIAETIITRICPFVVGRKRNTKNEGCA